MEDSKIKVLLIEDNKFDQMAFKRLVDHEDLPYNYTIAGCLSEAEKMLKSARFDVIIADYYLGDGTLFDIFSLLGDTPIIIATGAGDEDVAVKAMKEGAYDYLIKDLDRNYLKVLPVVIKNAINHKKSEKTIQDAISRYYEYLR